jgi:hypothetical protein
MMGSRRPLSRLCCALAVAMAGVVVPALHTGAVITGTLACAHLHASYSFTPPEFTGSSFAVQADGSCTTGGAATATTGSGTVTLEEAPAPFTGAGTVNHYDLALSVGGTTIVTVFDALQLPYSVPVGPPLSEGVFDYGGVGTIQFDNGASGHGVLNEHCSFDAAAFLITCDDDAVFLAQLG